MGHPQFAGQQRAGLKRNLNRQRADSLLLADGVLKVNTLGLNGDTAALSEAQTGALDFGDEPVANRVLKDLLCPLGERSVPTPLSSKTIAATIRASMATVSVANSLAQ